MTLRVVRVFPTSDFCDIWGGWAITTLGSPYKLGRLCQEGAKSVEVKRQWRFLVGGGGNQETGWLGLGAWVGLLEELDGPQPCR